MINSDRESLQLEGPPKGGRSRKVGGENVERIQDNEEDAKNKCDNTSELEKRSLFCLWYEMPYEGWGSGPRWLLAVPASHAHACESP